MQTWIQKSLQQPANIDKEELVELLRDMQDNINNYKVCS